MSSYTQSLVIKDLPDNLYLHVHVKNRKHLKEISSSHLK